MKNTPDTNRLQNMNMADGVNTVSQVSGTSAVMVKMEMMPKI